MNKARSMLYKIHRMYKLYISLQHPLALQSTIMCRLLRLLAIAILVALPLEGKNVSQSRDRLLVKGEKQSNVRCVFFRAYVWYLNVLCLFICKINLKITALFAVSWHMHKMRSQVELPLVDK